MNTKSEVTTDNTKQDRARPRRMKQPTKDELRARIESLEESLYLARAERNEERFWRESLQRELESKRRRAQQVWTGNAVVGAALAATACVAGVWLAPLLPG